MCYRFWQQACLHKPYLRIVETVYNSSVVQETQGEEEASGQAGGIRQTYRDIRKLLHATVQALSLPWK